MNETLFLPAGDSAVNVEFGRTIDPEINKKIRGLSDSLSRKPIRGVTECIPTFRSLLVCYDPLQTGCEALIKKLKKRIKSLDQVSGGEKRVFNIPVCYGGEFGEDIAFVASHAGLTEQEVIDIHTGRDYLIFMLGFLPGFAYLGDMDKRLHTPRLSNPRTSIPAGSVGIRSRLRAAGSLSAERPLSPTTRPARSRYSIAQATIYASSPLMNRSIAALKSSSAATNTSAE